jgi:predicted dehydrogenase
VKRSGDLIVENAVHNIDACNWIANSRPVSAYGHGKKYFPEPIPPGKVMMDGFSVEYIYENDMHCDYSQISFHPRHLKTVPSGMWYTVFGEKGSVYLTHSSATFYDVYGETEPRSLLPADASERDTATADFFACIREQRQPFADVRVGAIAALTAIMGREAIYKRRSVTWKELGVEV